MLHRVRQSARGRITPILALAGAAALVPIAVAVAQPDEPGGADHVVRAALPPGSIKHILLIELENSGFNTTYGPGSAATYLNTTLRQQGELIDNYYATGHSSLDNYIAQVSGQSPTPDTDNDCPGTSPTGTVFINVSPGTDDPNPATNPGQVDGNGCVYPAPTATSHGAPTIADQLDAAYPPNPTTGVAQWRAYEEDMGNDPARDNGTPDPNGGTDCAHPTVGGVDLAEGATPTDQYANRHNPFIYFHSIIDNTAVCNANEVPLGTLQSNGTPSPTGALARDLSKVSTTPKFGFITPNTCDDGHDNPCVGLNDAGTHVGGTVAIDAFLQHWMPLILGSPAYKSGSMLVVITTDESEPDPVDPPSTSSCCYEQPGPNIPAPGDASATTNTAPGGGKIGMLLLDPKYVRAGSEDTTGSYNHYSALRSYEDLLGLTTGGTDGQGHLGFAAAPGLAPFGPDVFNNVPDQDQNQQ